MVCSFSFVLLLFYVAGSASFEILHLAFHDHESSVMHTDAEEHDACHRSVYHADTEQGCGHASHFVEKTKCDLCDSIVHRDETCGVEVYHTSSTYETDPYLLLCTAKGNGLSVLLPSRGPPAI